MRYFHYRTQYSSFVTKLWPSGHLHSPYLLRQTKAFYLYCPRVSYNPNSDEDRDC